MSGIHPAAADAVHHLVVAHGQQDLGEAFQYVVIAAAQGGLRDQEHLLAQFRAPGDREMASITEATCAARSAAVAEDDPAAVASRRRASRRAKAGAPGSSSKRPHSSAASCSPPVHRLISRPGGSSWCTRFSESSAASRTAPGGRWRRAMPGKPAPGRVQHVHQPGTLVRGGSAMHVAAHLARRCGGILPLGRMCRSGVGAGCQCLLRAGSPGRPAGWSGQAAPCPDDGPGSCGCGRGGVYRAWSARPSRARCTEACQRS
ncbi:hypothetical protein SAMN04489708_13036 [Paracidovorax cattleyae]|uniref:Uncharacterized protein n=1 Tax=Paracidovorax cattleyae TaxID=80868 RepID=A0A1H0VZ91_9BURK|nr:hypothetical protein SAMN04489708_13036 [Paracidovorax cattleyae]